MNLDLVSKQIGPDGFHPEVVGAEALSKELPINAPRHSKSQKP
jgi:hypothetical protein